MLICFFLTMLFYHQVFDVMRKQEQTRLAELAAEKAHFEAIQSQAQIVSSPCMTLVEISSDFYDTCLEK